ncbi:hypothetical protein [Actinoplanes sp. L3-i22]|uniref:hypothetical protein n=1 Tax=Actinoplanes sp. L3-i22 TaxID=2836373 RepID=UPI001C751CA8|nr:hypothetical protein [Actinoplanes sp. L3-i22]BCY08157.1 hypothetical protein L3i22_032450 [Actinoplanes sp. L3-i22]
MESTSLPATAEPVAEQPDAPAIEQPAPVVPALIFLESADGAGVCDVDGVCN